MTITANYLGYSKTVSATASFEYKDPCYTTTITGSQAAKELASFEGYTVTSSSVNVFTDSASTSANVLPEICGDKEISYQINSQSTLDLVGGNNSPITFSPNTVDKVYGTFPATQHVNLVMYGIVGIFDMNVTILALVEPVVTN